MSIWKKLSTLKCLINEDARLPFFQNFSTLHAHFQPCSFMKFIHSFPPCSFIKHIFTPPHLWCSSSFMVLLKMQYPKICFKMYIFSLFICSQTTSTSNDDRSKTFESLKSMSSLNNRLETNRNQYSTLWCVLTVKVG